MKKRNNPFTLTFGKQPNTQISRFENISNIMDMFSAENPVSQTCLIEGIRGSGKTVLMTTVCHQLAEEDDWIIVHLNPAMELLRELAWRLSEACKKVPRLLRKGFQLSIAGTGFGISGEEVSQDYVGIIEDILKQVKTKNKRVLITIDEVQHSQEMRIFASQFQIFIREDYPLYLIMTGLYENLHEIQNDPALTFLLRAPKVKMEPLSLLQIRNQYRKVFEADDRTVAELAGLTRGYAFAFQALGSVFWNSGKKKVDEEMLETFDAMLDDYVYKKIWEGLTSKDREIILAMREPETSVRDICNRIAMSSSTFAHYRDKLIRQGILQASSHGMVALSLPRFVEIAESYLL